MEKILLAIDSTKINLDTLDFACYVAVLTHSRLTGVFLLNQQEKEAPVLRNMFGVTYAETVVAADIPGNVEKKKLCEKNIQLFMEGCQRRGISCNVHVDKGVATSELIAETRFADLLIVDSGLTLQERQEETPSTFLREILAKSECPVAMAPPVFRGIEEIVFAYDGSSSAVYALKQFTHLFKPLNDKKITVLQVNNEEDEELPIIEKEKIADLLKVHYSSIGFQVLQGRVNDELGNYLHEKKNAFVIMGAFGRTMLSVFLKRSAADLVIKRINLPLFIAHR